MKVTIDWERCIKCMGCLLVCSDVFESYSMNIVIKEEKSKEKCKNCKDHLCIKMCPTGAIILEK